MLTAEGKAELKRTAPVHMRGIVEHFVDQFDEEELATIEKLFSRLAPERD